jgi:uncharacterized glyoxalase superfamily protein PhnB
LPNYVFFSECDRTPHQFYEKAFEKAVSNGAKEIKNPEEKPWGQIVACVQDSFGTIVEICSPMGY